jgi:hypothetical protein
MRSKKPTSLKKVLLPRKHTRWALEEDTKMRKSIIAGLTLCAVMGAGDAQAIVNKPVDTPHKHAIPKAEVARPAEAPTQFRIPAHPLVYDCVHVAFPQCSRGFDGLNDGSFRWGR